MFRNIQKISESGGSVCARVRIYTAHKGHIITVCFMQIHFSHFVQVMLVLTSSAGLQTRHLFLFPSSNLERS